jgi:hypothetical protein
VELKVSGFRIQDSGFRIQDSGFRIQDSGFRERGSAMAQVLEQASASIEWRMGRGWRRASAIRRLTSGSFRR